MILFSLLAGFFDPSIAMWLPLIGFLLGCIIIGVTGQFRVAQAVIIALAIYIGAIMLVTLIAFMSPLVLGPLNLGSVADAWINFRDTIFGWVLPLQFFSMLAEMASFFITDTISHDFVYNLISFSFFGLFGILLAGLPAYAIYRRSYYVAPTPKATRVTSETSFTELFEPADQRSAPSTETMPPPPQSTTSAQPPAVPPPPSSAFTPPPAARSTPRPTRGSSTTSASPTAQAIMREGGKGMKRLKSTGQKVPAGQSRCPYCNETIIRGSSFCNACNRKIG
ncbi:MAG: hypothetical protein ACFFDI_05815 [Promethearchaeota archaeon]